MQNVAPKWKQEDVVFSQHVTQLIPVRIALSIIIQTRKIDFRHKNDFRVGLGICRDYHQRLDWKRSRPVADLLRSTVRAVELQVALDTLATIVDDEAIPDTSYLEFTKATLDRIAQAFNESVWKKINLKTRQHVH